MHKNNETNECKEQVVHNVGEDSVLYTYVDSNLKPVAIIQQKGKSEYSPDVMYFLYDDKYVGPFDEIDEIVSSEDCSSFLFVVIKNEMRSIYLGDKMVEEDCKYIDNLTFSYDGQKYAYSSKESEGSYIIINGKQSYGPFDSVYNIFFPASDKLYFFARNKNIWDLYINGKAQNLNCDAMNFFFPIDGSKCSAEALFCFKKNEKHYTFFTDGRSAGPFDAISFQKRSAEKTGDFAYVIINNGKNYLYRNNKKIAGPFLFIDYIGFSKDEENLIYVAKENTEQSIYVDKSLVIRTTHQVGFEVTLSYDKKAIYYSSYQGGMWQIGHTYLDDEKKIFHKDLTVPYKCQEILHLGLLKDGCRIFYTTSSKNSLNDIQYLYLQGFGSAGPFILIEYIAISPDGNSFAFSAYSEDGWSIYLNAELIAGPFKQIKGFHFSKDGKILRFVVVPFKSSSKMISMIHIDGKIYVGSFDKENKAVIYLKDNNLIRRPFNT